jgi:hypothetical protein
MRKGGRKEGSGEGKKEGRRDGGRNNSIKLKKIQCKSKQKLCRGLIKPKISYLEKNNRMIQNLSK